MEDQVKVALEQLGTIHAGLSEAERQQVVAVQFALVTDDDLCALIEYCHALLRIRLSQPRD